MRENIPILSVASELPAIYHRHEKTFQENDHSKSSLNATVDERLRVRKAPNIEEASYN